MKIMQFSVLLLFLLTTVHGQDKSYRNYKFEWKPVVEKIPVEKAFEEEDAVILKEEVDISFTREFHLGKHIRIKYLTEKGVRDHATFVLPESFDPVFDYRYIPTWRRNRIHQPSGEWKEVKYFKARIIKPDGTVKEANIEDNGEEFEGRIGYSYGKRYVFTFRVTNLKPGDELEVYYRTKYFREKCSNRFFFHGELPKQNYQISFAVKEEAIPYCHFFVTNDKNFNDYYHPEARHDSVVQYFGKTRFIKQVWYRKNLPGCLNEKGARIINELPFLSFYCSGHRLYNDLSDFGFSNNWYKNRKVFLNPPWNWFDALNENPLTFADEDKQLHLSYTDKKTLALNKFFEETFENISDTTALPKFLKLHDVITHDFEYQDDTDFLTGEDNWLERMWYFIEIRTLREWSRYNLYYQMLYRIFDSPYYEAITTDKRIHIIQPDKYSTIVHGHKYFAVNTNKNICFAYPKSHRFGHNINEFPFYIEGANTLLIPVGVEKTKPYEVQYKFVKTPLSNQKVNFRQSNIMATVNLDSLHINFKTRLILSGQFSTMTRGLYLYGYHDQTVNPKYHIRIDALNKSVNNISTNVSETDKRFPFQCNIELLYDALNLVAKKDENKYRIDLKNWFNYIYYENFSAENRQLPFYPDFQFLDAFKYFLSFEREIKINNEIDREVQNELGSFSIKVKKMNPKAIMIETYFSVDTEKVPADKVIDVEEIYAAIDQLNNAVLEIEVAK